MSAKNKSYLIMAGIATVVSMAVVWASNNVEVLEDTIG